MVKDPLHWEICHFPLIKCKQFFFLDAVFLGHQAERLKIQAEITCAYIIKLRLCKIAS